MDLVGIIRQLDDYWRQQGCLIGIGYDREKGAGTMNPLTFFRTLGPEPWATAYVEPCRRPADGRYGESPNRLSRYLQYQVLIKPVPKDIVDRYRGSLSAIGLPLDRHDFRLVEDNWEHPSLGAWGLGWEVWLDGMEVTQFTYFQQVAGIELKPISVEITYGLERLAAYIQEVDSVYDLAYDQGVSYGEMALSTERQNCRYAFEAASVPFLRQSFEAAEAEGQRALAAGLWAAAYDQALDCSRLFNLLEARRALAWTERAALVGRIRTIAQKSAGLWLAEREQLGFPLRTEAVAK
jgi:glycyl-tRNA synthetase alpha chain